ncbi:MAG: 3-methyl-2-oxobutanoate hydroxymethyltransferase [Ignavibacteriaceae bacterium]|jgi:3-methyl-2-oxobutanoate hydroxymethyltransferase|nr:3-methyl-2-oxobutanoate hydroxymethyltransferase [Ignavibacteriaceae bacterium]
MKTVQEFSSMKLAGKKISIVTCYDHWSALILEESDVDAVLVGDSAAMVMHGFETTINAELEMMRYHVAAVKRGLRNKFLIADLPFLAHKKGLAFLTNAVDVLMKAGAQAVKLEGAEQNIESIKHLVSAGVPVMGHLGLTPQSINKLGGNKLQGNDETSSERILRDAKLLEESGCFSIVLEMVPTTLAKTITETLSIPTIGIGAGVHTSGQVLVLQDLLGCSKEFNPKFLRKYLDGFSLIKSALNAYSSDVREQKFPSEKESY